MGNEISRVYQFISNFGSIENWQKEVDEKYGNGDGTVIKTEFRNFMLNEFGFETGDNENDLINKFWASTDTKTSGKIGATGLSNKNALDADELKRAEEAINATNKISEFVMQQDVPAGISNIENWRNSVKESLLNKALVFLKQNKDAKASDWDINEAFQSTNRQTTADYVAKETIQDKLGEIEGYDADKDKALSRIVDTYVRSLSTDSSTNLNDIVSHVKELVSAYADTAETNSESSIALLGSSYNASGNLNDLQMAKLTQEMTKEIQEGLKDSKSDLYNSYKEFIEGKIPDFVKSQLQNVKAKDFNEIKGNLSAYTDKFVSAELADIEKEYNELQDAKKELKGILSGKYTDKYKDAIKEVFGKTTQNEVEKVIDGYNKIADVTAAKTQIETKIDEIDSQVDESFFNALKDVSIGYGETQTIKLPDHTDKYSTNEISYQVENGNGIVSINSSGNVTIRGNQTGTFKNITISLYANGKKIGTSKAMSVTIKENGASTVAKANDQTLSLNSKVDNWNNDKSFKELYNNDENVILYGKRDTNDKDWDHMKNTIRNNLIALGNQVKTILENAGLTGTILDKAVLNIVNTYCNAGCIKNYDDHGTSQGDLINNGNSYMSQNRETTKSRIIWTIDNDASDSNVYQIHFKDFIDDVVAEYYNILEGNDRTVTNQIGSDAGYNDGYFLGGIGHAISNFFSGW